MSVLSLKSHEFSEKTTKEVEMPFERESAILVKAERERTPVGPISDLVPGGLTLKDAHTICEER